MPIKNNTNLENALDEPCIRILQSKLTDMMLVFFFDPTDFLFFNQDTQHTESTKHLSLTTIILKKEENYEIRTQKNNVCDRFFRLYKYCPILWQINGLRVSLITMLVPYPIGNTYGFKSWAFLY